MVSDRLVPLQAQQCMVAGPSGRHVRNTANTLPSIFAHTTSLKHRPIYFAIVGGVETTALAFGPLISGALADSSTWRLAFWFIVPIAATTTLSTLFGMGDLRRSEHASLSRHQRLKRIDRAGFAINVPMTVCLVLALQWGGNVYHWSNWRIVLLIILAGVLLLAFLVIEHRNGPKSMLPLKTIMQRSVSLASLITFCNVGHLCVIA